MCGIVGIATQKGRPVDGAALQRMNDSLAYRGPDAEDTWISEDSTVGFGHRRLSIIDLSEAGKQPMLSSTGRFAITYNGEIYNYQELRAEAVAAGYPFRGHSDTEVILAGCELWGLRETVDRLAGMFAMAICDQKERTVTLVRDRIGIKPLYYRMHEGALAFASVLKPLVIWTGSLPPVSESALAHYLRLGYVPAPHSIFEGIFKLPAGTMITFANGELGEIERFWSVPEVALAGMADPIEDEEEVLATLDSTLRHIVDQHMISDVPLGAFLSGGIDSSTVTAFMQAQRSAPVKTFSIGFDEKAYNEAVYAAEIAEHLGTDHTELTVRDEDARAVIPEIPDIYDEPFADLSQIPTVLVSRLARQKVTVSLSGDGGDELFGGYNRYIFVSRYWRQLSRWPVPLRRMAAGAMAMPSPARWDRLFDALPARYQVSLPGQKVHKAAAILAANDLQEFHGRLISQWANPELIMRGGVTAGEHEGLGDPRIEGLPIEARQMAWDMQTYLVDDILAKVDRASMSVGLEARVPLLDHRMIELAWRVPLSMKFREGGGKWILKKLLGKYVPPTMFERPKMGFGVPIDEWLRGPLREWAGDSLAQGRADTGDLINRAPVLDAWNAHLTGRVERGGALWTVLMFDKWLERAKQWV